MRPFHRASPPILQAIRRFVDVPGLRDPGAIVDMGAFEYRYPPLLASGGAFLFNASLPSVTIASMLLYQHRVLPRAI